MNRKNLFNDISLILKRLFQKETMMDRHLEDIKGTLIFLLFNFQGGYYVVLHTFFRYIHSSISCIVFESGYLSKDPHNCQDI